MYRRRQTLAGCKAAARALLSSAGFRRGGGPARPAGAPLTPSMLAARRGFHAQSSLLDQRKPPGGWDEKFDVPGKRGPWTADGHNTSHASTKQESFGNGGINTDKRKKKKKNTGIWQPIPIALGIVCIAIVHFIRMANRASEEGGEMVKIEGPWHVHVYAALPLRGLSRLWGWGNELTVPVWLRVPLYKTYASMFGCNLDEMEDPNLEHYSNLGEFFYRTLKPGARTIDQKAPLVSPADGRVLHFGLITLDRTVEQIKGVTYSLDALLGRAKASEDGRPPPSHHKHLAVAKASHSAEVVSDAQFADINSIDYSLDRMLGTDKSDSTGNSSAVVPAANSKIYGGHRLQPGNSLFFAVVYLAPGDYHRFHSPADWKADRRRHFSGELYSVSPLAVNMIKNLFVLNERVVLMGEWAHGFFSMIPVGATNVGSIKVDFDPELRTNLGRRQLKEQEHAPGTYVERVYPGNGVPLVKGEQMGGFKLGSTVVLVFEAPSTFEFTLEAGQVVRVGEPIGRLSK
ncbi:phosphatidylserine decarboxylase 1 precursor [Geranomyces variabilis]|nr:phosphatidylserine decarboxylase 1 precursor [Geranomyces variabilis]KAJ3136897.1 phosphatidylserine decarboxylase 1 [Geranomyces variabilis]